MKFHKVEICGHTWQVALVSDSYFIKYSGEDLAGLTILKTKTILINEEELTKETITHELCHALFHYTSVGVAHLDEHQTEEVWCELIAIHYSNIGKLTKQIYNLLKKDL